MKTIEFIEKSCQECGAHLPSNCAGLCPLCNCKALNKVTGYELDIEMED